MSSNLQRTKFQPKSFDPKTSPYYNHHLCWRLFGSKPGTPNAPPGTIYLHDEQKTLPNINLPKIKRTISEIRDIIGYPTYDVSLLLVDDDEMREINLETRGVNSPTDILSFPFQSPQEEDDGIGILEPGVLGRAEFDIPEYYGLGDMMVDVPYVIRGIEADREVNEDEDSYYEDERGVSGALSTIYDPEERIRLLLVHGMLHLVGYDHEDDDDYELMVNREEEVMKLLHERMKDYDK